MACALDLHFCHTSVEDEFSIFRFTATPLPGHFLREFTDTLRDTPTLTPYTALSDAIKERFGASAEQRPRVLLSEQQLGERRPQCLRHPLDLAEARGSQDLP